MKTSHILTAALAVGIGIASVNGEHRKRTFGDGDGELPEKLQQYDLNEDGMIDEEERQAAKEARKAEREERKAEREAERQARFDAIDTDGDGELSDEEKEAARAARKAEQEAKKAERIAALEAKREEKFTEVAGDDGVIDAEELAAKIGNHASAERVAALFDRMDADDSDGIDLAEFSARLRTHRGSRGHGHSHGRRR